MGNEVTEAKDEKDLEISSQDNLFPEKHVSKTFDETYKQLTNIKAALHYMDEEIMKSLITLTCPRLEYATVVYYPYRPKDITKVKRTEREAPVTNGTTSSGGRTKDGRYDNNVPN